MEKLERKSLQESYLQKLIAKQQATAVFEHREMDLCRTLKANRMNLPEKIEAARAEGMDAGTVIKIGQFAQASRAMDEAREAYYAACDGRMAEAFKEACE
jgi:hypothetical protein